MNQHRYTAYTVRVYTHKQVSRPPKILHSRLPQSLHRHSATRCDRMVQKKTYCRTAQLLTQSNNLMASQTKPVAHKQASLESSAIISQTNTKTRSPSPTPQLMLDRCNVEYYYVKAFSSFCSRTTSDLPRCTTHNLLYDKSKGNDKDKADVDHHRRRHNHQHNNNNEHSYTHTHTHIHTYTHTHTHATQVYASDMKRTSPLLSHHHH